MPSLAEEAQTRLLARTKILGSVNPLGTLTDMHDGAALAGHWLWLWETLVVLSCSPGRCGQDKAGTERLQRCLRADADIPHSLAHSLAHSLTRSHSLRLRWPARQFSRGAFFQDDQFAFAPLFQYKSPLGLAASCWPPGGEQSKGKGKGSSTEQPKSAKERKRWVNAGSLENSDEKSWRVVPRKCQICRDFGRWEYCVGSRIER